MSAQIVNFPASYIHALAMCLKAHSINLGKPDSVKAAQNYLDQISGELLTAIENGNASRAEVDDGIEVDWCEANLAFAVTKNGQVVECFPTHTAAKNFAKELASGVVHGKAAEAQA